MAIKEIEHAALLFAAAIILTITIAAIVIVLAQQLAGPWWSPAVATWHAR